MKHNRQTVSLQQKNCITNKIEYYQRINKLSKEEPYEFQRTYTMNRPKRKMKVSKTKEADFPSAEEEQNEVEWH